LAVAFARAGSIFWICGLIEDMMTRGFNTTGGTTGQQAMFEGGLPHRHGRLAAECWSILATGMEELFPLFFFQLDLDLFKLSERAESNAYQMSLLETLRLFRHGQDKLQAKFMRSLAAAYEEYWHKPEQADGETEVMDANGLSLMEDEALEEILAINGMIEKGNLLYRLELYSLNQRFCALFGREEQTWKLPFSPECLCRQFATVLDELGIDRKTRILIYKIFDQKILSKLGTVYQHLNAYLAASGVLATISHRPKEQKRPESKPCLENPPATRNIPQDPVQYLEAFQAIRSLLDNWRRQTGNRAFSSAAAAAVADSEEVIGAIGRLQSSISGECSLSRPMSAENLKRYILVQLGANPENPLEKNLGRVDEDIIDMVGMIFNFILDEPNLAATIKYQIARLQIPILKVAIMDRTIFAKQDHVCRRLLNELAQAGIGLDLEQTGQDSPILVKVEEVVNKILAGFGRNIGLFQELLDEFKVFIEKESARVRLAENRTIQVTQGKEKIWLAKKAVACELTLRLSHSNTPASFRSFIYNDWKNVLLLAYLRREKNDWEWKRALEIMDKMIWSITPPANGQEGANVIREIPEIVRAIREGLETTSVDARRIETLLKDLEICQLKALNRASSYSFENPTHEAALPTGEVMIGDEELLEAMLEVKSGLGSDYGLPEPRNAQTPLPETVQDPHKEAANRLKIGDWMDFAQEGGRIWRAKLVWKSAATGSCLFVNWRGVKVLELKLHELAQRMREGQAKPVNEAATPLMDRALACLVQNLRKPFEASVQSPSFS